MSRFGGSWPEGPLTLHARPSTLDVWRADLKNVPVALKHSLSPAERRRAAGILSPIRRERWMRSRALLRELLGRYTAQEPRSLAFTDGDCGRPTLRANRAQRGAPFFALAHSGSTALYAFTGAGEVAVDLELVRPLGADELRLARRAFGRGAEQRLEALPPEERGIGFLRLWVRHEAQLKLAGTGIWSVPRTKPWLLDLPAPSGARECAALAAPAAPALMRYWEFSGATSGR